MSPSPHHSPIARFRSRRRKARRERRLVEQRARRAIAQLDQSSGSPGSRIRDAWLVQQFRPWSLSLWLTTAVRAFGLFVITVTAIVILEVTGLMAWANERQTTSVTVLIVFGIVLEAMAGTLIYSLFRLSPELLVLAIAFLDPSHPLDTWTALWFVPVAAMAWSLAHPLRARAARRATVVRFRAVRRVRQAVDVLLRVVPDPVATRWRATRSSPPVRLVERETEDIFRSTRQFWAVVMGGAVLLILVVSLGAQDTFSLGDHLYGAVHQHRPADKLFLELTVCGGLAAAYLLATQFMIARSVLRRAKALNLLDDAAWSEMEKRHKFSTESGWAIAIASVAFIPTAFGSEWLPFVVVTAVTCAVVVPRVRLGWEARSAQREHVLSSIERNAAGEETRPAAGTVHDSLDVAATPMLIGQQAPPTPAGTS